MLIRAKFSSKCENCGRRIYVGDLIEWERGKKAVHALCPPPEFTFEDLENATSQEEFDAAMQKHREYECGIYKDLWAIQDRLTKIANENPLESEFPMEKERRDSRRTRK